MRLGGAEVTKTTAGKPASAPPSIQRGINWEEFKRFAKNQWGEGGFLQDNAWIPKELDPRGTYHKYADKGGKKNKFKGVMAAAGKTLRNVALSPLMVANVALSTVGRGLTTLGGAAFYGAKGIPGTAKEVKDKLGGTISEKKRTAWDPLTLDQKSGMLSNTVPGALAGASALGGAIANFSQKDLTLDTSMVDADPTLRTLTGDKVSTVSSVGQGFAAGGGILGGLSGLSNMGRGLANIFSKKEEGKGYQRFTRGFGRTLAGAGQTFAGITTSGKAIANLAGATTPAAQFMAAAAAPAQAAMSGIDVIKGVYGLGKAGYRKKNLRKLQKSLSRQTVEGGNGENKDLGEFARLAKRYQSKRQRTAGINLASGVLGALGAGLVLSGVGAPVGMALMGAAGALKFGGALFGTVRDKIFKGKAAAKKQKELDWARTAAKNYKDANIKNVLKAMGAESIALNDEALAEMTEEERVQIMLKQLMKR